MSAAIRQFWLDNPELAERKKKSAAWYGITYFPINTGAQQIPGFFQTDADCDFVMTTITASQMNAGYTAYVNTPLIALYTNKANTKNVNNIKLDWSIIAATPVTFAPPYELPYPILLPRSSQFQMLLDNPSAADTNVYFAFGGIKVW